MSQTWSFEETLLLTNFVAAHGGLPWPGPAPANPEDRFIEVRDRLFPSRTPDAVYMQAWAIARALDLCAEPAPTPTRQIVHVAALYRDDRMGMSTLAADIEALQQIRARATTAAALT